MQSIPTIMLIYERDVASVIMRAALDTCPLFSLAGHCLVSGCTVTGTVLVVAPVADFYANSLVHKFAMLLW